MRPAATERILARTGPGDRVLDVGGWAAPFRPATHVLDLMRCRPRGAMGGYGPEPERFSADTWTVRDICDRNEVPTLFAELIYNVEGNGAWLGYEHHRWLVEEEDGGLVFTHKPHSLHSDWRVRVLPRWAASMTLDSASSGKARCPLASVS